MLKNFFASNLVHLRSLHNKTQTDIGLQVSKGHTTIGNWEKGKNLPSASDAYVISQYFEIDANDLMFTDLKKESVLSNKKIGENVGDSAGNDAGLESKYGFITSENERKKLPYKFYEILAIKELDYQLSIEIENLNDVYNDFKKLLEVVHLLNAPDFLKDKFPLIPEFQEYRYKRELDFEDTHKHLKDERMLKVLKIVDLYQAGQEHTRSMISKCIRYMYQYSDLFISKTVRETVQGKSVYNELHPIRKLIKKK